MERKNNDNKQSSHTHMRTPRAKYFLIFVHATARRITLHNMQKRFWTISPSKEMKIILRLGWGAAILAHLVVFSQAAIFWRTAAAGVILAFTPGIFLVAWLLGRDVALTWGGRILYGWAAGYALWIWGVLFLSYLPGGITQTGILVAFDLLAVLFCGLAVYRSSWGNLPRTESATSPRNRTSAITLWLGLLLLIATALFLRFVNLNYSEFQGDEAKVMLHAVGVIQGQEEVLFTYRKGPTEILIPAGLLALLGVIDEGSARAPFAFANLICLLAVFIFGWRLFGGQLGALAGWIAAMLLAVDGYFIGYTRIVQYPSLIFLMGIFSLDPLARLAFRNEHENVAPPMTGYILLAALFAATGSVTHYEGALVALPAIYLCWLLWRQTVLRRRLVLSWALALVIGAGLLLAFYVPFIRHPFFTATVARYASDVVGDSGYVYNRLPLFAANGALYNTIYAFGLTLSVMVGCIFLICWRVRRWRYGLAVIIVFCLGMLLLWVNQPGGDLLIYALIGGVGLLTLLPVVLPTASAPERLLWLWLSIPFLINAFFLKDPNTHFYVFYTPWMLICGQGLAWLWQQTRRFLKPPPAYLLGGGVLVLTLAIFGGYAYAFFVAAPSEVVRHWDEQTLLPAWLRGTHPQDHAIFGTPHYSGWRMVGQLYADGTLQGNYATNMRHWIPEWYIRHGVYCETNPALVFLERLERSAEQAELQELMGDEYRLWGIIHAYNEPRIEVYRHMVAVRSEVVDFSAPGGGMDKQPFTAAFEIASTELMPLLTPLGYRFGDQIELVGYRLPVTRAQVGSGLPVTLVWRALQPLAQEYTLFMQLLGAEDHKVGQLDTRPSCNAGPTTAWEVGELLPGYYQVPLFPNESPGVYPLLIGLYDSQSQERLPLYSATGEAMGNALELAQITVKP